MAGGQDARDVALTGEGAGGFEIRLVSVIFCDQLAEIHGHFGPVHTVDFSPDGFAFGHLYSPVYGENEKSYESSKTSAILFSRSSCVDST